MIGLAARIDLAEGAARGRLEGVVRRVDRVGLAVVDHDPQADHREPDQPPLGEHGAEALLDRGDELGRDRAAAHLVHELEVLVALGQGLDVAGHAAVLAGAAGLLLVRVVELGALRDRLAVGHLRRARLDLAAVLALHALDVDVEVQLAHAGDDGLAALGIHAGAERRVLAHEAAERLRQVVLRLVVLGLDRERDHRRRARASSVIATSDRPVGEGVARRAVDAEERDDVAGAGARRCPPSCRRACAPAARPCCGAGCGC